MFLSFNVRPKTENCEIFLISRNNVPALSGSAITFLGSGPG